MKIITLQKAINQRNQDGLARLLGVTQGAVWQASKNNRNIFIVNDNGVFSAFEVKPVFKTKPDIKQISKAISK